MEKLKNISVKKTFLMNCAAKSLMKGLAWGGASFVFGFGSFIGFPSYMNVACAAVSGKYIISSFLGSCLWYVLFGDFDAAIVPICAILCIAAIKAINPIGNKKDDPLFLSITVTGTLMLFSCVMTIADSSEMLEASMRMISSLMSGCAVYSAKALENSKKISGMFSISGLQGILAGILYICIIASLACIPLFSLNLGRIIGVFLILESVKRYKNIGGAVTGAITACAVLISQPSLGRNTLLLATSGLICGAFSSLGSLMTALIFLASSLLSLVAVGVNADTFHMFADLVVGTLLYIAFPMSFINRVSKNICPSGNASELVGQTTSSKLIFAGETIGSIRQQLNLVTAAMDKKTSQLSCAKDVKEYICTDCENYPLCFGKTQRTEIGLSQLENIIEKYSSVTQDDVKRCLKSCSKPTLVCKAFEQFQESIISERADNIKMREMREFLVVQLSSMEDILTDLSFRTSQVRCVDENLSAQIRNYFNSLGYTNTKACVYTDDNLCLRAEVYISSQFKGDLVKITAAVCSVLDCDMGIPVIIKEDKLVKISFAEIPDYNAQISSFSASAGGEYSGDSYEIFDINSTEKYAVISDGMGTGKRARLDSVFTVSLTQKLISSGISMQTAHRLINSMLRVKGWEESFATLDLLKLDLYGGCARFLKSGSPSSRLCRDGCVVPVGGQAFPVGIFSECSPDLTDVKLFDGDILVMVSDGVDDQTADDISQIAAEYKGNLDILTRHMGEVAMKKRNDKNPDDITIITVRIIKNSDKSHLYL